MGNRGKAIRLNRATVSLCAGLLALAAWAVVPASAAKPKKVSTKAGDLFVDADSVSGTISSGHDECKSGRTVKLRLASGKLVASDKTNKRGYWTIDIELSGGSYYAEVLKATKKGKQNGRSVSFNCGAAKTKTADL